ncbi:hypothetical protein C7967_11548 [Thalassospira sp. 11-3]|nr:hypothetical protein C7967_11548 [Thalassospira sp. 11-3]
MARDKATLTNIDKSNLTDFPNGRIKDNSGAGDGTPVNERVYGDLHEVFAKLMRLYGISYNGLPDNETNGYQLLDALVALASKNDYILDIGSVGGKLTVPVKLGSLKTGESIVCKATVNKGSETVIKGTLDNTDKTVSFVGSFLNGEYVRLINTGANITLVRLVDISNIDSVVTANSFLKAATTAQEKAGTLNTVATTPLGNILAFAEWVNGTPSAASLATALRNGLYPKEHFSIVENIGNDRVRNIGFFSGIQVDGDPMNTFYTVGGDVTVAKKTGNDGDTDLITITMANAMDNTNYFVRTFIQSQGNQKNDSEMECPNFRPISTTQFILALRESGSVVQNLKIHMEVVQIS